MIYTGMCTSGKSTLQKDPAVPELLLLQALFGRDMAVGTLVAGRKLFVQEGARGNTIGPGSFCSSEGIIIGECEGSFL